MELVKERDDPEMVEFGSLLRVLREKACLTQEELAERSGVSIRAISDLERGRTRRPHRNSVNLLAEALRITDDAMERFRQVARRTRVRAGTAVPLPREEFAPVLTGAVTARKTREADPRSSVPAGVLELIEWMRQVLIVQPDRWSGTGPAGPRVVQLVGDLGAQKAAVVVQATAQFQWQFPDGLFYLNARAGNRGGGEGAAAMVSRLSQVFGVEHARHNSLEVQLHGLRCALRSRRALLVLDDVVDAAEVRPILIRDSACAVIVIARDRIDLLEGAWTVDCRSVVGGPADPVLLNVG